MHYGARGQVQERELTHMSVQTVQTIGRGVASKRRTSLWKR